MYYFFVMLSSSSIPLEFSKENKVKAPLQHAWNVCVGTHFTILLRLESRVPNKFNLPRKYQNTHLFTQRDTFFFYASLFIDKKGLRSYFSFFNLFLINKPIKHVFCCLPHLSESTSCQHHQYIHEIGKGKVNFSQWVSQ